MPAIDTIVGWAYGLAVRVLGIRDEVGRIECSAVAVDEAELVARSSLLVSLGGDGTMLRTMRLLYRRPTLVLGVNLGRLGFLAEVDVADLPAALSAIDEHRYTVEDRAAVSTTMPDGIAVTAFNDIAVVRVPGHRLGAVEISVQGCPFVRYAAGAIACRRRPAPPPTASRRVGRSSRRTWTACPWRRRGALVVQLRAAAVPGRGTRPAHPPDERPPPGGRGRRDRGRVRVRGRHAADDLRACRSPGRAPRRDHVLRARPAQAARRRRRRGRSSSGRCRDPLAANGELGGCHGARVPGRAAAAGGAASEGAC